MSGFSAHEPDIQILQFARGIQHYKCGVLRNFEEKLRCACYFTKNDAMYRDP